MCAARHALQFRAPRAQVGAALLVALAVVGVIAGLALVWIANTGATEAQRAQNTARAMGMIRDALIARAAADKNRPGSLPCPDVDNDGQSLGPGPEWSGSGCTSYVGRVPWKTLDMPDLRDADGEPFWYALSPIYRDSASAGTLNSDTAGQLTITGTQPAANVVAIIFTPGPPLPTQDRVASPNAAASFLEGDNANGDFTFETGDASATFNDRLLVITRDMLMPVVEQRVARQARRCLENFAAAASGRYPFPAAMASYTTYADTVSPSPPYTTVLYGRIPSTLVATNYALSASYSWPADDPQPGAPTTQCFASGTWWSAWRELLLYRVSAAYAPNGTGSCATAACLTVNAQSDVKFVVIVAGSALSSPPQSGRTMNKTTLSYYLEAAPNPPTYNFSAFAGSGAIGKRPRSVTSGPVGGFNDRVECASESGGPPCD